MERVKFVGCRGSLYSRDESLQPRWKANRYSRGAVPEADLQLQQFVRGRDGKHHYKENVR